MVFSFFLLPSRIIETEDDTKKKIENMKVIYELLLRTQQSIGVNDAKVKELNAQLVGERKTVAAHEKVKNFDSPPLAPAN